MDLFWLGPYRVRAFNSAQDGGNRVHGDAIGCRFGFAGGLVPGVDVFGYMTHMPVRRWGRAWLQTGTMTARFSAPVYDGDDAVVTAADNAGSLEIHTASRDTVCAEATAGLGAASAPPPMPCDVPTPPPPDARPVASAATLAPGVRFGIRPLRTTAENAAAYLHHQRETDPLYRREGLLHPGLILRTCNWVLTENVCLGPWIHAGSSIQMLAAAPVGSVLSVTAVVAANHVRNGHGLVELDAVVLADGAPVAQVRHMAIWRPRRLSGGVPG